MAYWCTSCYTRQATTVNGMCVQCGAALNPDPKPGTRVVAGPNGLQRVTTPVDAQPSVVPIGSVCHKHPSALARWRAEMITARGVLDVLMCDHCHTLEYQDLEDAGWVIAGAPVVCACVACEQVRCHA